MVDANDMKYRQESYKVTQIIKVLSVKISNLRQGVCTTWQHYGMYPNIRGYSDIPAWWVRHMAAIIHNWSHLARTGWLN